MWIFREKKENQKEETEKVMEIQLKTRGGIERKVDFCFEYFFELRENKWTLDVVTKSETDSGSGRKK